MFSNSLLDRRALRRIWLEGTLAGLLSSAALAWCGRRDTGRAVIPLAAPSHWVWPQALCRERPTRAQLVMGHLIHHASSVFWALFYRLLQARRERPTPAAAAADAAAVTAVAALVDLKLVPQRLTPGFERRLSGRSLCLVYLSFGAGLALGGALGGALGAAPRRR